MPKTKQNRLSKASMPRWLMSLFIVLFAAVGALVVWRLFAASNHPGLLETELMKRTSGVKTFHDQLASGGAAVVVNRNVPQPAMKGTIGIVDGGYSYSMMARAIGCKGFWPTVKVTLSGDNGVSKSMKFGVNNRVGWAAYTHNGWNIPGNHQYSVHVYTETYSKKKKCQAQVFMDAIRLRPQGVTLYANNVKKAGKNSANIKMIVGTHNTPSTYFVQYDTSSLLGLTTQSKSLKHSGAPQKISVSLKKLAPNSKYYYRLCGANAENVNCSKIYTFRTKAKGGGGGGDQVNTTTDQSNPPGDGGQQCVQGQHLNAQGQCENDTPSCPTTGAGSADCHPPKCVLFSNNPEIWRLQIWDESAGQYVMTGNICN